LPYLLRVTKVNFFDRDTWLESCIIYRPFLKFPKIKIVPFNLKKATNYCRYCLNSYQYTLININLFFQDGDRKQSKTEIFVKNLDFKTDNSSLQRFFESKFGNITRVNILMRDDGKSKGIGFIGFEKAADAQAAMDAQDDLEVDGRKIGISWANERKEAGSRDRGDRGDDRGGDRSRSRNDGETKFTCFVGNLGFKTSEGQIRDFFKAIGNVKEVRVGKHEDGRSKGFAHVDFENKDALTEALTLNGKDLDGRDVKLDESKPFTRSGDRGGFRGGRGGSGGFRGGRGGSRDGGFRGGRGGSGGYRGGRGRDGDRDGGRRDGGRDRDSYRRRDD